MVDKKKKHPECFYKQSGVLPYFIDKGKIKVLLITSRKGKKWIIPKGIIEPKMTPWSSAEKEAFEEAGIKGRIFRKKIASYVQKKWNGECNINIYLMRIDEIYDKWEEDFRKRKLLTPDEAANKIDIKPLKQIIENIEKIIN